MTELNYALGMLQGIENIRCSKIKTDPVPHKAYSLEEDTQKIV